VHDWDSSRIDRIDVRRRNKNRSLYKSKSNQGKSSSLSRITTGNEGRRARLPFISLSETISRNAKQLSLSLSLSLSLFIQIHFSLFLLRSLLSLQDSLSKAQIKLPLFPSPSLFPVPFSLPQHHFTLVIETIYDWSLLAVLLFLLLFASHAEARARDIRGGRRLARMIDRLRMSLDWHHVLAPSSAALAKLHYARPHLPAPDAELLTNIARARLAN